MSLNMLPARQQGVALITSLLVTALAVTLVAGMFWQQQVQVRSQEAQRLRLQARLVLRGVLDEARLAVAEGAAVTTLDGRWAAPVRGHDTEGAALTRAISDAQARYNLRNLAGGGGIDHYQLAAFARLLRTLRLDPALAGPIADAVRPRAPHARIALSNMDDLLAIPGLTPDAVAALREHVTVLPEPTAINVNTASAEVLTAVANLTLAEARALVAQRRQAHFRNTSDFALRLNERETLEGINYAVSSSYFLVTSSVALERVRIDARSLLRRAGGAPAILWTELD